MHSSTHSITSISALTELAHLLSVDRPGSGICKTFLKYRYAFGLTDRNDIALAISCEDHVIWLLDGFSNIRIFTRSKHFSEHLVYFVSTFSLPFLSFSSCMSNLFCVATNCFSTLLLKAYNTHTT